MSTASPTIPEGARVLKLTLKKHWFDLMLSGQKRTEYRKPSKWVESRLKGREYDYVACYNGGYTGGGLPWFLCPYEGQSVADCHHRRTYGGHVVPVERGDYQIHLGPVVQSGNLKPQQP